MRLSLTILFSDEESFVCDICHKHFSSREKLEDHELLHEDVKLRALDTHDIDQVPIFFLKIFCKIVLGT